MILIVGLGNPGAKYKDTRHNVGWQMIDHLHKAWSFVAFSHEKKFKSEIAKGTVDGTSIILVKPQTFMNASGESVQALANYFDIPPERIWILHDELDLPFGSYKFQKERGAAGHNGITSIIESLGTNTFHRVRIGISPSAEKRPQESKHFVLKKFSFFERRKRQHIFSEIQQILEKELQK